VQEIALCTTDATLAASLEARKRVHEAKLSAEHSQQLQALKESLQNKFSDPAKPVRDSIINDILTLRCPRCRQAFVEFDGCMAVTCSRVACKANFCGICLADCGSSGAAHQHIRTCRYGIGEYHGRRDSIRGMQNAARKDKIMVLLRPLAPALAVGVVESLQKEFRDVGLEFLASDI
jgi:hypothetical protein